MKNNNAPLIIEVTRGNIVESCHSVNMVISDSSGKIVRSWGNIESPVYLRSAIKPLQALPLVETGAADAFAVSEKELSLACASHNGEEKHVDAVLNWLERIGLSETDLQCGVHWPSHQKTSLALAANGLKPTQAHNNCSGKHTGFLTTALHMKEPIKGYIELDHPVQQRIVRVLEDFTGIDLSNAPVGRDGCSIPTLGIPLDKSALAIARFADPSSMHADRAAACKRIQNAIARQPDMMAGLDRLCTALNGAANGRVIAKVGAEGVYLAALPEHGFGIALKTVDGTTRAAEAALGAALQYLGVMDEELHTAISPYTETILKNRNDFEVGKIRAIL